MDVALVERALKDVGRYIQAMYHRLWHTDEDRNLELTKVQEQITAALIELRKVPTCEPANEEVEAALNAFIADRENSGLPTYISKSSWRNHIQGALTAAALWRMEHEI